MGVKMKRRKLFTLIGGLAMAWQLVSYAQQPKQPLKRVGLLLQAVQCPLQSDNPMVHRLRELGWIEGQTIVSECVSALGRSDQVPALARELVSRGPDVLTASPWNFISALKQETTTIPIVMIYTWEPVQLGLIANLAQPGGNVTGVAGFNLLPKHMEVLKEIVPNLKRVAYIREKYLATAADTPPEVFKLGQENRAIAATALGFTWQIFDVAAVSDYDETFTRLAAEHFGAAYIPATPFNIQNQTRTCQLALRHRIPVTSESAEGAKCGFLLGYSPAYSWILMRAADYVDKILRGAKPSDLPVEQATKLDLVINLKTANEFGLTVPPSLLARADKLVE
jgi:putative ABC transport system substrate-binding protein